MAKRARKYYIRVQLAQGEEDDYGPFSSREEAIKVLAERGWMKAHQFMSVIVLPRAGAKAWVISQRAPPLHSPSKFPML